MLILILIGDLMYNAQGPNQPRDLEGRTLGSGGLVRRVEAQLPARIQPVHGYHPEIDVIPITWKNRPQEPNPNLEAATRAIMRELTEKYGASPSNIGLMDFSPGYTALLKTNEGNVALGPGHVFTWGDTRNRRVPILERERILGSDGKRMRNESLQVTIFEHPEQKGTFLYQVVHNGVDDGVKAQITYKSTLYDAGYYRQSEQRVVSAKQLPAPKKVGLPSSGIVKR